MNIGFTYDLRDEYLAMGFDAEAAAEFDKPETIDAIAGALSRLGHTVDRIGHIRRLVDRLAAGDGWDLVFNIAEGHAGLSREAQVPALLEAYGMPFVFADALCLSVCLHKGVCKRVVRDIGIPTPEFVVVEDAAFDFADARLAYPVFAKPVAEGTGKGVSSRGKAGDAAALRAVCLDLLRKYRQPVLVEEFLPGREFTVGIVGSGARARILGIMEVTLLDNAEPDAYSYDNKDKYEDRVRYSLAIDDEALLAGELALKAYRGLGCRDGGRADLRSDAAGNPRFMEINPLAGLNPVHSDLPIMCRLRGIEYQRLIADILESAMERL